MYVYKRPNLDAFLKCMARCGNITVFTAGVKSYADPIIDMIDRNKLIKKRFYREDCHEDKKKNLLKDMAKVTKNMARLVIVDDNEAIYNSYKKNCIQIAPWTKAMNQDVELYRVEELVE